MIRRNKMRSLWDAMKRRCYNKNYVNYRYYGGRGIKVCERWKTSFAAFLEDMGECPPGMEIDRINNDGDYEPGNCRWATRKENCNNKSKQITHDGRTMSMARWAEELGIKKQTLHQRIKVYGWPLERALAK